LCIRAIKAIAKAGKTKDILIVAGDGQKSDQIHYGYDWYGCTAMNSPVQIGKI
jgi:ribose transport system substrate-binding protein